MGYGVVKNSSESVRRLRQASDQGYGDAQANLGLSYAEGLGGLAQNWTEAARLFRLAADQGNVHGMVRRADAPHRALNPPSASLRARLDLPCAFSLNPPCASPPYPAGPALRVPSEPALCAVLARDMLRERHRRGAGPGSGAAPLQKGGQEGPSRSAARARPHF
jgi:TPR repeat protein